MHGIRFKCKYFSFIIPNHCYSICSCGIPDPVFDNEPSEWEGKSLSSSLRLIFPGLTYDLLSFTIVSTVDKLETLGIRTTT